MGHVSGLNCDSKHDCMLHQTCHEGYCKCDPGYVEVETHCLEGELKDYTITVHCKTTQNFHIRFLLQ
jgi:hypothetical protein